jgi:Holliday junction resolvase RusA-like endonuclease
VIELVGLPFPPSLNSRLTPMNGRLITSKEHRVYKNELILKLVSNPNDIRNVLQACKDSKLSVRIKYRGDWYTKDKKIRKIDVDNRHKALIDVIFDYVGGDDAQIFKLEFQKVQEILPKTLVDIEIIEIGEV